MDPVARRSGSYVRIAAWARPWLGILLASVATAADLVRDIDAVPVANSNTLIANSGFVDVGRWTAFVLDDGVHGGELWRSDGTPQGTAMVLDINPGLASSNPCTLAVVGSVLYFSANDGTNGSELWRSDGTATGTYLVADIAPGPTNGVLCEHAYVMNDVLYFSGWDASGATQLWRSEGTAKGTYRLTNILPTLGSPRVGPVAVVGTHLFFTAADAKGEELYVTDGTTGGTHVVAYDPADGVGLDAPGGFVATPVGLYYTKPVAGYNDPDLDFAFRFTTLWFADPAGMHTAPIESFSSTSRVVIGGMAAFGDGIILAQALHTGNNLDDGIYRVTADASPVKLAEVTPNTTTSGVDFIAYRGRLLFSTVNAAFVQPALWSTDGTAAGTAQLGTGLGLQPKFAPAFNISVSTDGVFFYASSGSAVGQYDIWQSDGTESGTHLYAAVGAVELSDLAEFNGKVYFAGGRAGPTGWEPWVSDGTIAGTHLLADLMPGPGDTFPFLFTVIGNRMYFAGGSNEASGLL